jgi:hypothetical protein
MRRPVLIIVADPAQILTFSAWSQKDFQPYLDICTDELEHLYWYGCYVPATNASSSLAATASWTYRAKLLSAISDYRGYPELFNVAQAPALKGACYKCEQGGTRLGSKTIYPGLLQIFCQCFTDE